MVVMEKIIQMGMMMIMLVYAADEACKGAAGDDD